MVFLTKWVMFKMLDSWVEMGSKKSVKVVMIIIKGSIVVVVVVEEFIFFY